MVVKIFIYVLIVTMVVSFVLAFRQMIFYYNKFYLWASNIMGMKQFGDLITSTIDDETVRELIRFKDILFKFEISFINNTKRKKNQFYIDNCRFIIDVYCKYNPFAKTNYSNIFLVDFYKYTSKKYKIFLKLNAKDHIIDNKSVKFSFRNMIYFAQLITIIQNPEWIGIKTSKLEADLVYTTYVDYVLTEEEEENNE